MNQFQLNLPGNVVYTQAQVQCNAQVLDTRAIEPLTFDLEEPVIVGREHGMHNALKQMRSFSEVFGSDKVVSLARFTDAFNDHYAPEKPYVEGESVTAGGSYTVGSDYYIALANTNTAPSLVSNNWLYLGNSNDYIEVRPLAFSVISEDFTALLGSSTYFNVPTEEGRVLASEAPSGGRWFGSGGHTKITVVGINKLTGEQQAIIVRGQLAGSYAIDAGRNSDWSSPIKFYLDAGDNPAVPAGDYDISFYAYGTRWHNREVKVNLLVEGSVQF